MDIESIKKSTLEMLGSNDPEDVSFITEEYLAQNFEDEGEHSFEEEDDKGVLRPTYYVHNTSFDGNYYRYQRGDGSRAQACSHALFRRVPFSHWHHRNTGDRCSHGGGAHSQVAKIWKYR